MAVSREDAYELRSMAESIGLEVPQAATLMMEAADTVDRLDAENARLQELVRYMWHLLFDWLFKNHEVPWKELEAAHDRIRELGIDMYGEPLEGEAATLCLPLVIGGEDGAQGPDDRA